MKTYNLYVTDMAPNGTRDLVITDNDNQIISTIDEAVFGGQLKQATPNCALDVTEDYVHIVELDYGDEVQCEVFHVSLDWVKRHIAVSPVQSAEHILSQIHDAINA